MSFPVKHRCAFWESLAFEHRHKFQHGYSLSRTWKQKKQQKNTTEGTKKVKKKNSQTNNLLLFFLIWRILWKSPGLRSQSPGFSGLVFKTSRCACDGGWKVWMNQSRVTFDSQLSLSCTPLNSVCISRVSTMVWCLCGASLLYPYDPNMPVIKSQFMKLVQ